MRRGDMGPGVLTLDECQALAARLFGMVPRGKAQVELQSGVSASTSFARGDSHVAEEVAGVSVSLRVVTDKGAALVEGSRVDDEGLKLLVAEAEAAARQHLGPVQESLLGSQVYKPPPKLFFEENLRLMTPEGRASLVDAAFTAAEAAGLLAAGDVTLLRRSRAILNTEGLFGYTAGTYGELSLTARTKDGQGSGWSWSGHEEWSRVKPDAVIARAIDLAQRTAKPVAVEPGRYTVILEPEAVAALLAWVNSAWAVEYADGGLSVFARDPQGTNKVGLQMMDARLGMVSDPWDPDAPQPTVGIYGDPVDTARWFEHGVLKTLQYGRSYAAEKSLEPVFPPENLRLVAEGPTQTLEEMIASTSRGIWVNRLSGVDQMNYRTLLLTGTTRDGAFLIENGKITKAIKNLRFTESPFFVLNKLEAFGEPVRASSNVVAPRLKVRDFDFTSLTDAV